MHVTDTIIRRSGQGTGTAMLINPGVGVTVKANVVRSQFLNSLVGLKVQGGGVSNVSVFQSVGSGNAFGGFVVATSTGVMQLDQCASSGNGQGITNPVAGGVLRIGSSSITGNTSATSCTAACSSYGDNHIDTPVTLTAIAPQ